MPEDRPGPSSAAVKPGLFRTEDGQNCAIPFALVTSLFLLWGLCNGLIDTMDKHFQDHLKLSKAQSAWVQFAHYMGYTVMALPAGMITRAWGYKLGIIFGLLLVSAGGFWFLPATHIEAFWAYLLGVWLIAMGLTVLESVANPYTTVLGARGRGSTRINLAQSFNGIGWILGPIVGGAYFYSEAGVEVAHGQLYIPYLGIAIVVLVLAAVFYFSNMPEIKVEDAYHPDDESAEAGDMGNKKHNRTLIYVLMVLNVCVLGFAAYMILKLVLPVCGMAPATVDWLVPVIVAVPLFAVAAGLVPLARKMPSHNIWARPHFSSATLAQFLYVAAQAGIFSFIINYLLTEMPAISKATADGWLISGHADLHNGSYFLTAQGASRLQAFVGFALFCVGRFAGSALINKAPAHRVLGAYAFINAILCGVVILKFGWISVAAMFLTFFFMSVMFPTIFALGIHGFGSQSRKRAAAFIVMSITGGALMPKIMGYLGDIYNMSVSFWMPMCCFFLIALYGFLWPALAKSDGAVNVSAGKAH